MKFLPSALGDFMRIVEKVRMNEKGQIIIPLEMLQRAGIHRNDEIFIADIDDLIRLTKPQE